MFTDMKRIAALSILIVGISILATCSAHADFILGLNGGLSFNTVPSGYPVRIGGATTSGQSGIGANQMQYRDVSRAMNGGHYGLTVGYLWDKTGVDLRARRVSGSGDIARYTRTTRLAVADGQVDYSVFMLDFGFRWFPLKWAYLRPHLGWAANGLYKYDMSIAPRSDSDSEKKSRFAYGLGAMAVVEVGGGFNLEMGIDYTAYGSTFGGSAQEVALTIAPTFHFGQSEDEYDYDN